MPIGKLRSLGGKFGDQVQQQLDVATVGQLAEVPPGRLEALFGEKDAAWLARLVQGLDDEQVRRRCRDCTLHHRSHPSHQLTSVIIQMQYEISLRAAPCPMQVKPRLLPKSVGCSKTFRGHMALKTLDDVHTWLDAIGVLLLPTHLAAVWHGSLCRHLEPGCSPCAPPASPACSVCTPVKEDLCPDHIGRGRIGGGGEAAGGPPGESPPAAVAHRDRRYRRHAGLLPRQSLQPPGALFACAPQYVRGWRILFPCPVVPRGIAVQCHQHLWLALSAEWNGRDGSASFSKSCPLRKAQASFIACDALALIKRWADQTKGWAIHGLSLSTGNFVAAPTGNSTLERCQALPGPIGTACMP